MRHPIEVLKSIYKEEEFIILTRPSAFFIFRRIWEAFNEDNKKSCKRLLYAYGCS